MTTDRDPQPNLLAALARVLGCDVVDLPSAPPYSEALEQRMAHVADTFDPETGTCQRMRSLR